MQEVADFMRANWGWILSFVTCMAGIGTWLVKQMKGQRQKMQALEKGLQALLRSQLYSEYRMWAERGYVPLYARDNFDNLWEQYEALGKNNVMNDIYKRFRELPIEEEKKQ